ncbi:MAG: hypothetical protein PHF29_09680 [Candidatus Riflebacteria bacterium]|nr:hypothetical protein [Candidatus Riflebacteria bacterium]
MSDEKFDLDADKIFEACNATLNSALRRHCPIKNSMPCLDTCLCCGDSECFDSWREQNRLWNISDSESIEELRNLQNKTVVEVKVIGNEKALPHKHSLFDLAA